MATGRPGRKYFVELFDVQTFHARRKGFETRSAPAVALELGTLAGSVDAVRAELVALLVELQEAHGAGVGVRLCPLASSGWCTLLGLQVWCQAITSAGLSVVRADDGGDPIAVHPSVLTAGGELAGTTCQAAR